MFKNKKCCFLGGGGIIFVLVSQTSSFYFILYIYTFFYRKCEVYCGVTGQPADPAGPVPAADTDAGPGRIQGKETASVCVVMALLYLFCKQIKIMKVFQIYRLPPQSSRFVHDTVSHLKTQICKICFWSASAHE